MSRVNSPSQGDVFLVPYPFSDLSQSKYRPVIVVSNNAYNKRFKDFIAIPLTSNLKARDHTVPISNTEMTDGALTVASIARVDKIFSLEQRLIVRTYGHLRQDVFDKIRNELIRLIS